MALAVCDNAAFLPDGNAQIPEEFSEALGVALVALEESEREQYKGSLSPGQPGLNTAQVSLQRAFMDEQSVQLERLIDAADHLYLSIFDEVIIPGEMYLINCSSAGVRYISQESIKLFQQKYADFAKLGF